MKILINSLIIGILFALKVDATLDVWLHYPWNLQIGDNITMRCMKYGGEAAISWDVMNRLLLPNENVQNDLFLINGFKTENNGEFCCHGSHAGRAATSCRTVVAKPKEIIELSKFESQVAVNGTIEVECRVLDPNGPKINLHWERSDDSQSTNVIMGEDGHLKLSQVTKMDAGAYICRGLSTSGKELARKTINLTVVSPPKTIEITGELQYRTSYTVTCEATGDELSYNWTLKGGDWLPNESPYYNRIYINGVQEANDRIFCCKAYNAAGYLEECSQFPLKLLLSKPRGQMVLVGDSFQIDCQPIGNGASGTQLKWRRANDSELPKTTTIHDGLLRISNVTKTDAGDYNCLGFDGDRIAVKETVTLKVVSSPKIPFSSADGNVTYTCAGYEPNHYESTTIFHKFYLCRLPNSLESSYKKLAGKNSTDGTKILGMGGGKVFYHHLDLS